MKGPDLQEHMAGTYFSLRWGMAGIAFAFPLFLAIGGLIVDHEPLRGSMSAYYHSETLRDVFVGVLVAVGACLYLYKGFSTAENIALNLAGLFAVAIALVPTEWNCGDDCRTFTVHRVVGVLFFASIAYVSLFRASDTLSLIRDTERAKKFRVAYRTLGIAMVVSPVAAFILAAILQPLTDGTSLVFFIEAFAVWMFAAYWFVKSREMAFTQAERLALETKLATADSEAVQEDEIVGKVVQLEP